KDTYERFEGIGQNRGPTNTYVARKTRWIQDTRRAVDYLETRDDIDFERLAYWGLSWGAEHAPIALATDDRFRAGVMMDAGALMFPVLPAADEANFAPRVRVPILMVNGRHDYIFPLEAAQRPLFELLGTPESDKRHVLFESGHVAANADFEGVVAAITSWLDTTFGRVN
ncbi:MAG: hypothetical protein MJB57_02990, partial [Gemmatimonadetes bacterium]|nr:hypothetical protein [Gemmatimonadota bacterium]